MRRRHRLYFGYAAADMVNISKEIELNGRLHLKIMKSNLHTEVATVVDVAKMLHRNFKTSKMCEVQP